jgi:DNA-directed RNA polymerase subunit alpha
MQKIAEPNKIKFSPSTDPLEGVVTVEPLFPGYGMTLGNALRRVLLSSLSGAAVIGVKIAGASHEFMALPHIKEDVLEMVLNLKQLRLKIYTDEEVRLELKVKGKKTVTAGDISKNSQIEIKNPDLVIGHITSDEGSLNIQIFVKEGRGYRAAKDLKKESREIGYIAVDSIFSSVTLVNIDVENTRVGKMTNWDKLILKIKTDGTVSVEEAFNQAVRILVDQYTSLLPKDEKEDEEKDEIDEENIIVGEKDIISEESMVEIKEELGDSKELELEVSNDKKSEVSTKDKVKKVKKVKKEKVKKEKVKKEKVKKEKVKK